jgi:hypothetical protein
MRIRALKAKLVAPERRGYGRMLSGKTNLKKKKSLPKYIYTL